MITVVALSASILQVLDTTIANIALPHMQGSLGATQDQIAWVITSYIVVAAITTPLTGFIASRVGRTQLFISCIVGFTVASLFCGLATTLPQMVAFRILQGAVGALLVPLSQAILLDAYPRGETARAMGIFATGVMVGPVLGPIIGGYLTEEANWRWCFYINAPIGIATALGAFFSHERRPKQAVNWTGWASYSSPLLLAACS
jgi:DHA2 family multidrug resistance protein